jgi:predicted dehydrogenase
MAKLNVGMIGYKFMGKAHSNAWRQVDKFFKLQAQPMLKVICGRHEEGVRAAARQYGWRDYATDWRAVVRSPDIDIVDINTPNDTHAAIAIEAARAGKAVLCEKPLAMTVAECRRMVEAVRKARVTHMICHNYRRIPAMALAKKMIDHGELGEIHHYRARYLQDWIADPKFPLVWRLKKEVAGSGAHGDIHAHIIDLGRFLLGEVDEVCGLLHTFVKRRPLEGRRSVFGRVTVDDAALALVRFKSGAIGSLEATRFAVGRKNCIQVEVNGSKGSIYFDFEDMNRLKFYRTGDPEAERGFRDILVTEPCHPYVGQWWPPGHIIGYEHTFVHTFADFLNAVAAGKGVSPDFEDGLRNQIVLEAIEKSSASRRWVRISK